MASKRPAEDVVNGYRAIKFLCSNTTYEPADDKKDEGVKQQDLNHKEASDDMIQQASSHIHALGERINTLSKELEAEKVTSSEERSMLMKAAFEIHCQKEARKASEKTCNEVVARLHTQLDDAERDGDILRTKLEVAASLLAREKTKCEGLLQELEKIKEADKEYGTKEKFHEKVEKMKDEQAARIETIQNKSREFREALRMELQRKLDGLRSTQSTALKAKDEIWQIKQNELKSNHRSLIDSLKDEHSTKLNELKAKHTKAWKIKEEVWKDKIADLKEEKQELSAKVKAFGKIVQTANKIMEQGKDSSTEGAAAG